MPLYISELTISSGEISNIKVQKRTQTYTHKHILNWIHTHIQAQSQYYMLKTQIQKEKKTQGLAEGRL